MIACLSFGILPVFVADPINYLPLGANLALVDAWVLSECMNSQEKGNGCFCFMWQYSTRNIYLALCKASFVSTLCPLLTSPSLSSRTQVADAIRQYDQMRRWRLRFYQMNSRLLTPVFQSDLAALGLLRDIFMGPLCKFPPTRYQMLTTLCGAQNNGIPWTTIPEEEFMGFLGDDSRLEKEGGLR